MREDAKQRKPVFAWETEPQYTARLTADPGLLAERMQQAAVAGDVAAQIGFAHMLLEGHGAARDPEAALRWFQIAARSGSADATNMVGRCHELGWGTPRNARLAAHAYRAAADQGHAWANFNLAMLMLAHEGAEGDSGEILARLVRSARRGNAKALCFIGQACEEAWRGKRKPAAARRWYERGARRGCFRAAFNFARLLMAEGDLDGAVGWLRRSVEAAPGNFCTELAAYLVGHPEACLREVAALALERALSAPSRPVSEVRTPDVPAFPSPKAPPSVLARGGRSVVRALRCLAGGRKPRRT